MPFYLIEQRGVPGARLVEADKPQGAINHVIGDSFTAKKVDGRDLLDAAAKWPVEVAGAPVENAKVEAEPETPVEPVTPETPAAGDDDDIPMLRTTPERFNAD